MIFEYDSDKNSKNIKIHHISIPKLATVIDNSFLASQMYIPNKKHRKKNTDITSTAGYNQLIREDGVIRISGGRN